MEFRSSVVHLNYIGEEEISLNTTPIYHFCIGHDPSQLEMDCQDLPKNEFSPSWSRIIPGLKEYRVAYKSPHLKTVEFSPHLYTKVTYCIIMHPSTSRSPKWPLSFFLHARVLSLSKVSQSLLSGNCLIRYLQPSLRCSWLSSVPPSKKLDNTFKQATTASFYLLLNSAFIIILSFDAIKFELKKHS
jgi:hypothetical protein